jgi:hypothetical protein
MEIKFKYEIGQEVDAVGNVNGAAIIGRGFWESSNGNKTVYYEVRLGDKTFQLNENEITGAL